MLSMHTNYCRHLSPLWRWTMAATLFCGLVLLGCAAKVSLASTGTHQSGFVASVDIPLHSHAESSFVVKSPYYRNKHQPQKINLDYPTPSLLSDLDYSFPALAVPLFYVTYNVPTVRKYKLQQLNTPRAPPLA